MPKVARFDLTGRDGTTREPGATAGLGLTNDDMIFALFRTRRAETAGREGRSSCFAPICATQSDNVSLVCEFSDKQTRKRGDKKVGWGTFNRVTVTT